MDGHTHQCPYDLDGWCDSRGWCNDRCLEETRDESSAIGNTVLTTTTLAQPQSKLEKNSSRSTSGRDAVSGAS